MPCGVFEGNQHGLLEFLRASFELYYNVCSEKLFAFWFFFYFFFYFLFIFFQVQTVCLQITRRVRGSRCRHCRSVS